MNTTQDKWAQSLAFDIAFAEQLLTTRGNLNPMFIIEAGGKKHVVEGRFRNLEEKEAVAAFVSLWAISVDADAVTTLAEAWMSSPLPSKDADGAARQEVVLALAVYRDGDQRRVKQATHLIERNAKGRVTGLGLNLTPEDGDVMDGRFVNLLPRLRPSCEQRAHAKAAFDSLPFFLRRAITPKPMKPSH
jgi:hypothetical protein